MKTKSIIFLSKATGCVYTSHLITFSCFRLSTSNAFSLPSNIINRCEQMSASRKITTIPNWERRKIPESLVEMSPYAGAEALWQNFSKEFNFRHIVASRIKKFMTRCWQTKDNRLMFIIGISVDHQEVRRTVLTCTKSLSTLHQLPPLINCFQSETYRLIERIKSFYRQTRKQERKNI